MITKIIWVADFDTNTHPGGAQLTNDFMVKWGRSLGFDIEYATLHSMKKLGRAPEYFLNRGDFFILNNIAWLYHEYPELINTIIDTKRYIRYEHDYLWMHGFVPDEVTRKLFNNSLLNIFVSPLHMNTYHNWGISSREDYIIPSPLDFNRFRLKKSIKRKKNSMIYAGGIGEHKGIENILQYALEHPKLHLDIYGWLEKPELVENIPMNVSILKGVGHGEMTQILNEHEYFIHMPNWNEPFGRAVMEAYFCGCKLLTNDNIGALSYGWDFENMEEIKEHLKESPLRFWKKVNEILVKYKLPVKVRKHW